MIKEYKTISEVVGPLMLVKDVENVTYDELGEIILPSGEKRLCKVLEVNGNNALVQLFESSTGINLKESTVRFLGRGTELPVSPDILGRVFDGMGRPKDGGPDIIAEKTDGHQRTAYEPGGQRLSVGIHTDGSIGHRRPEHSRKRTEAAYLLRLLDFLTPNLAAQIARQAKVRGSEGNFAVVFAAIGITLRGSGVLRFRL